jgi:hypothetical protein
VDDAWFVAVQLVGVISGVGDHDDRVATVDQPGRRAVELHVSRAARTRDRVRLEPGAVVHVNDGNLFELPNV